MPFTVKKLPAIKMDSLDNLGDSVLSLAKFVEDEFGQVASSLQGTEPDTIWNRPPPRPRRGTYAYADGTNWNPGHGEGPYYYTGTVWVPLFQYALPALPLYKAYFLTRVLSLASGLVAYTGVGFKPRMIQFQTGIGGGANWCSFGVYDGSLNTSVEIQALSGGGGTFYQNGFAGIQRDDPGGANYQLFTVNSLDPNGFTLNWLKNGTPTATASVTAICFQ